ncbi:rhodanese-like domain-containing protein [Nonomuraea sp. C10]|uniref:rhodanese-like domain-containing protein n=1 Tax=Nonomuraea sp. C10 TaxID=2600577 RepID=UPI0021C31939|nr:rhodanese-like domain-containing protein [Nonomuraea sp. C10]
MLAQARTGLRRLSPPQAWSAAGRTDSFIVDTRPAFQRCAGEVPGAIVIERNQLEWRLDPRCEARIPEAEHARIQWIVLCDEGYSSSLAARSLQDLGLHRSTDVIGGFQAWHAVGMPIVLREPPTPPRRPGEGPSAMETAAAEKALPQGA